MGDTSLRWNNEPMAITARSEPADRAVGSRAGAIAVALRWAVLFYGVIDLLVGIIPSMFSDEYDLDPGIGCGNELGLAVHRRGPLTAYRVGGQAGGMGGATGRRDRGGGAGGWRRGSRGGSGVRGAPGDSVPSLPAEMAGEIQVVNAPTGCDPRGFALLTRSWRSPSVPRLSIRKACSVPRLWVRVWTREDRAGWRRTSSASSRPTRVSATCGPNSIWSLIPAGGVRGGHSERGVSGSV